jgi:hypothetical protein
MVVMVSTMISAMITMVPMISASSASPTSGENTPGGGEQGNDRYYIQDEFHMLKPSTL